MFTYKCISQGERHTIQSKAIINSLYHKYLFILISTICARLWNSTESIFPQYQWTKLNHMILTFKPTHKISAHLNCIVFRSQIMVSNYNYIKWRDIQSMMIIMSTNSFWLQPSMQGCGIWQILAFLFIFGPWCYFKGGVRI